MGKLVLLDTRIYSGGVDLSGMANQISLDEEADTKPVTNFRSGGARELLAGISDVTIEAEGQMEQQADEAAWANRRVWEPWSIAPAGDSDLAGGGLMYLARALRSKSTFLGGLGEVSPWQATAKGAWPLVRGVAAHPSGVPRTATGNGSVFNLGPVAAGDYIYANLHVLSISGTSTPTLTVSVQSDDAVGFPSATTRGSFAAATAVGGQAIRIAGPFTDTHWRLNWTISGTSPSFLFLAALGIE